MGRLRRAVEFRFENALRLFLQKELEFLAPERHGRRPVFAFFKPGEGSVAPVHIMQLAVMRGFQGLPLLFMPGGAGLVLQLLPRRDDHSYAGDAR
jgi:hypothetical protein